VVVRDPRDAVRDGLDLTRVQLGLGRDRRLRAALTLAADWTAGDLLAASGPPGSLCLRLWTGDASPRGTRPDHLVCVSAAGDADDAELRASVLRERDEGLPERVAPATVTRASDRTITVRFSQTSIGHPARVRFAGEATRPGCPRVSCVDTAPNSPRTATLRLRNSP